MEQSDEMFSTLSATANDLVASLRSSLQLEMMRIYECAMFKHTEVDCSTKPLVLYTNVRNVPYMCHSILILSFQNSRLCHIGREWHCRNNGMPHNEEYQFSWKFANFITHFSIDTIWEIFDNDPSANSNHSDIPVSP
jgi:hypothetical protein